MTIEELNKGLKGIMEKANAAINGDLVTDEWIKETIKINEKAEDLFGIKSPVLAALKELQARRKADKEHWHINPSGDEKTPPEGRTESERPILPIPCTVGFDDCTVKQWFQKINEELDELKEAILYGASTQMETKAKDACIGAFDERNIADEAADTITAITSICEAMGIDEQRRQEAQKRANERNRGRGRIAE